MTRHPLSALALSFALLAAPATVYAQAPVNGTVTYRGDVSNNGALNGGAYTGAVGPYRADLAFGPTLTMTNAIIWCVDWQHFAPAANSVDTYRLSALTGNLSQTRQNNFSRYLKAAWLFEQVNANGGSYNLASTALAPFSAKNVQGTVWELMDGASFNPGGNTDGTNVGETAAGSYGNSNYFNVAGLIPTSLTAANLTYDWYVLTDYRVAGSNESSTLNQEFMVAVARPVPEPASLALVLTGLGAIGAAARRRRVVRSEG